MLLTSRRGSGRSPRDELRRWRRTRPFWAGILLIAAGTEFLVVPFAPWNVLIGLGLGGIAALGIGAALIVAGLFLLFLPRARHYVGAHAVILSVLSFAASNLGGFLLGMLLGIAGGAMGCAWTPDPATPVPAAPDPATPDPPETPRGGPGTSSPPALAVVLPVLLMAATTLPGAAPDRPGPPTAHPLTTPTPGTISTTHFAPEGFTLAAVERLPTVVGPRKVMALRMRAASLTDYRLRTRDGTREFSLAVDGLRLDGEVTLYLTRFHGCVQGILCLTFDADALSVPPVVPPFVFMTDVRGEQALIRSDAIDAEGMSLTTVPEGTGPA
ncbi:DUF6114 domain-containing protein [Streptomyces sp. URMC 126]|uniref:DUF6114 domain-containing protein n=1 Tax=Streptomyces sp. URMC 126 TaxID=3423401 RepID=UPI003F1AB09F